MNRGEVWWVESAEIGRRPGLILTRQSAISVLNSVLVVPATRTIRNIPTEVSLDKKDGMPDSCALTLDNLTVVPRAMCTERITKLSGLKLQQVCMALQIATGCS